ncbi:peptide synthetase [Paramagnetospirillum marisnigri]|uniref:Peptide synthetase n=1 Tax=Paramagnetospirillum marisnigri TaxID=1285242 RepID=A0A178MPC1_9PROT|nr:Pls/PosA family non-ribosomal peptide synthetase [Paramagnetospirillum marisnigri]OAN50441.1 peptide synthetase [Paramagnetospirillum marisnigri]
MNNLSPLPPASLLGPADPSLARDELLWEIFAATATQVPGSVALTFGETRLTYGALSQRVEKVAAALAARGIGRGSFVGLWMSRSLDLHVALLAILRTGAAYIPFDTDAPAERVAECLDDCQARAVVVDAVTAGGIKAPLPGVTLTLPALEAESAPAAADPRALGAGTADPAYAIYTSGSTGKPKAIVISQRNICHYLRAANTVYGIGPSDVVFQGASVAFDLSLEEIFVPYMVGASLWVAGRQTLAEVDRLPDILVDAGITVMDTVPTLLSLMPRDIPSLRVIILGGEACPPALAERWCRQGRRIFNSYGPTEATVVATVAEVMPGKPVTIGRPIPNYVCHVVDELLHPVAPGTTGELLIGGPGVAAGYLGRPELTAEKFIANPWDTEGRAPILYRSGDAVSIDEDGNLAFHGRIDDQVKIRGFRVELGEIEARIVAQPGIAQAAVSLRTDDGIERLVAYVVAEATPDTAALRETLREQLPAYMVPSRLLVLPELPRLVSGKLNRKALKDIPLDADGGDEQEEAASPTEAALLDAARRVFPGQAIPFEADFFTELGGHSLLAAKFVSAVRETPALSSLTLNEIYALRTLRAMAATLDARAPKPGTKAADRSFTPPSWRRRFLCGLAQGLAMPFVLALITAPWLGVFVSYMLLSGEDAGIWREIGTLMVTYAFINVGTVAVSIALKWVILGRTRPGRHKLWGVYYFRWWLAQRVVSVAHIKWFQGTPIMGIYLRLLGARVGSDCIISELEAGAFDLVEIGQGVAIGGKVRLANAEVIGDELVIGPISIGDDAYIGTSCIIGHDTHLAEGVELGDMTAVPSGARLGAWEHWDGSPATRIGMVDKDALPAPATASKARKLGLTLFYGLMLVVLPPISLLPIFPAFKIFEKMTEVLNVSETIDFLISLPLMAWPTAMALIAITVLLIAAVRWSVLPVVTAGHYSVYGGFYVRKWIVALVTELTLETLSSLYATVYMRMWYRLMGAKIGKDAEISCNLSGRYDLTEIGERCFIADEVVLGDESIRRGWMTLEPVKTEAQVFVGNDAVVPPGCRIPTGTLIGIKSRPPANELMSPGDTWFGSPPIRLPVRQRFDAVGADWTYAPPAWKRLWRAVFEAFAVSLPTMLFITFGISTVEAIEPYIVQRDYLLVIGLFIVASVAISLALCACSIAVKWLMMGVYRPTAKPMWSWWALRTEAVAVMYWGLAGKVLLDHLRGTPFLPWVLRLYGCRFGRGVFMDTTDITEFDCIDVGDFCAINSLSALQTHLYEDRVMKVGRVKLSRGVTIGSGSTVLYDTHVGEFARIGALTIVMKGESIPAHGQWAGAPAQTVGSI